MFWVCPRISPDASHKRPNMFSKLPGMEVEVFWSTLETFQKFSRCVSKLFLMCPISVLEVSQKCPKSVLSVPEAFWKCFNVFCVCSHTQFNFSLRNLCPPAEHRTHMCFSGALCSFGMKANRLCVQSNRPSFSIVVGVLIAFAMFGQESNRKVLDENQPLLPCTSCGPIP